MNSLIANSNSELLGSALHGLCLLQSGGHLASYSVAGRLYSQPRSGDRWNDLQTSGSFGALA